MTKKFKKFTAMAAALTLSAGMVASLAGCGGESTPANSEPAASGSQTTEAAVADKMVYGSAAYAGAIYDGGVDPAMGYAGWSTFRYAIGECLVSFDEQMQVEPWVAKSFEQKDDKTWVFEINDGIKFHNGKTCDAAAVKASLERVMKISDRTADITNMMFDKIEADGNTLTITTTDANPILPNLLCDPLWCIVDADVETDGKTDVIGTGAYKLVKASEDGLTVEANEDYWNGTPKIKTIEVKSITDGSTLSMALQNGEIDAAQELPVDSLQLFKGNGFKVSTTATSRSSNLLLNTDPASPLSDKNVRLAVAYGINKQDFIDGLMSGYGEMAAGFFPQSFAAFGDTKVTAPEYNMEKAKELLKEAGWEDTDGSGYVDKDGKDMVLTYVTYSSRQDLPKLAEAFQDDMKDIGIKVELNIGETTDVEALSKDPTKWDINAWQMVTAPNGDPMYMIDSTLGHGGYYAISGLQDDELQGWIDALRKATSTDERAELAVKIQQKAIDEGYMIIAFHKEQSLAMKEGVNGLNEHPTDQHEISVDTTFTK